MAAAMNRRQRKREARRREMLDAAMEIIVDEGLDALTIAHLANSLDAAVGALYRYFPGKQGLILALEKRAIGALSQELLAEMEICEEYIANEGLNTEDAAMLRVLVSLTCYMRDFERRPARHRLIDMMMSTPAKLLTDEQATEVNEVLAPLILTCAKMLDQAAIAGVIDNGDAIVRTHLVWATLHGLDHFRKRDRIQPAKLQVKSLLPGMFRTAIRGWGGDMDAVDTAFEHLERMRPALLAVELPDDEDDDES